MAGLTLPPRIPLPRGWSRRVRSAVIHAISLANFSLTSTRSWAANSWNARIRLKAENNQLQQEVALLIAVANLGRRLLSTGNQVSGGWWKDEEEYDPGKLKQTVAAAVR